MTSISGFGHTLLDTQTASISVGDALAWHRTHLCDVTSQTIAAHRAFHKMMGWSPELSV